MGLRRLGLAFAALTLVAGCGGAGAPADSSAPQGQAEAAGAEGATTATSPGAPEKGKARAKSTGAPGKKAADAPGVSGGGTQFASLAEAADFAEEVTGRPAPIPRNLRLKGGVDVYIGPDGDVQFTVGRGDPPVVLRYGSAIGFDGCALPPMKPIEVGKTKGLLGAYDTPGKKYVYEALWPATPDRPVGMLAVSGLMPEDEILEQAEAIQKVAKVKGDGLGPGAC